MTLPSRIRERNFRAAVENLSRYYGYRANQEEIEAIARILGSVNNGQVVGLRGIERASAVRGAQRAVSAEGSGQASTVASEIARILNLFFNSTDGAYSSEDLIERLNDIIGPATSRDKTNAARIQTGTAIGNIIQIIADTDLDVNLRNNWPNQIDQFRYLNRVSINSDARSRVPIIRPLADGNRPSSTKLSIILLNSPRLNISNRNARECTVFLNNVPTYELAKAVPYLEVNFEVPLPALESGTNRLLAPTLYKFILGGQDATSNPILTNLANANQRELASPQGETAGERVYTRTGMELFTVPQTLLNRRNDSTLRVNDILDPTRPLLTLKSFSTSEVQSYAAEGYRTAKMDFVLHDRSRMPDIAPFVRADLRGNTRVDVEYGWIHPDGEKIIGAGASRNAYADLINGMRRREKYQIVNNSFSMQDNGSVNISLELATLGYSQFASDLIIGGDDGQVVEQLNEINRLMDALNNAIERTSLREEAADSNRRSSRINGISMLLPASDAYTAGFNLTGNNRRELTRLINSLNNNTNASNANLQQVRQNLIAIWGSGARGARGGAVDRLRTNLQTSIQNTIDDIIDYTYGRSGRTRGGAARDVDWATNRSDGTVPFDPLVIIANPDAQTPRSRRATPAARQGATAARRRGATVTPRGIGVEITNQNLPSYLTGRDNYINRSASLATIMLHFVGKPLLNSGYHEVQFIYYPFNENAAYASKLNIGNFEINLGMLTERLIDYRLNNMSRSGTMTLNQFWTFINNNIIDVPSASSYGLSSLYRVLNNQERSHMPDANRYTTVQINNQTVTNAKISALLAKVTPTGEFHPPQLRMITEALPRVPSENDQNDNITNSDNIARADTILRIHIFDQQATSIAGLGDILRAERNRLLSLDARDIEGANNNTPVSTLNNEQRNQIYRRALDAGIITNASNRSTRRSAGAANTDLSTQLDGLVEGEQDVSVVDDAQETLQNERRSARIRGGFREIKKFIMNNSPYILLGTENSLIKKAGLSSLNDPPQATLNLVNQPRTSEVIAANGEEPGNLPLQVIPVEASMTTLGCPLLTFFSQYFIDFNTGTTADDLYAITGIDSSMEPGSYRTTIKLRPVSGYTRYRNFLNELKQIDQALQEQSAAPAQSSGRQERLEVGGSR